MFSSLILRKGKRQFAAEVPDAVIAVFKNRLPGASVRSVMQRTAGPMQ